MTQISMSASIAQTSQQPGMSISVSGELTDADVQELRTFLQDMTIKIAAPAPGATP